MLPKVICIDNVNFILQKVPQEKVEGVRFGDRGGQEGHSPLAESPFSPMYTQEFTSLSKYGGAKKRWKTTDLYSDSRGINHNFEISQ
jgi:hypothetical protein